MYPTKDETLNERLWDKWQLEILRTVKNLDIEPFQDFIKNDHDIKETIYLKVG